MEIATLEGTSLSDGDLEQMATELFDIPAMTVKDDAPRDHPGDHELQRIRGTETNGLHASREAATAEGSERVGERRWDAVQKSTTSHCRRDEESRVHAAAARRYSGPSVPQFGHCQHIRGGV